MNLISIAAALIFVSGNAIPKIAEPGLHTWHTVAIETQPTNMYFHQVALNAISDMSEDGTYQFMSRVMFTSPVKSSQADKMIHTYYAQTKVNCENRVIQIVRDSVNDETGAVIKEGILVNDFSAGPKPAGTKTGMAHIVNFVCELKKREQLLAV